MVTAVELRTPDMIMDPDHLSVACRARPRQPVRSVTVVRACNDRDEPGSCPKSGPRGYFNTDSSDPNSHHIVHSRLLGRGPYVLAHIRKVPLTSLISSEIPIDPVLQQQSANAT